MNRLFIHLDGEGFSRQPGRHFHLHVHNQPEELLETAVGLEPGKNRMEGVWWRVRRSAHPRVAAGRRRRAALGHAAVMAQAVELRFETAGHAGELPVGRLQTDARVLGVFCRARQLIRDADVALAHFGAEGAESRRFESGMAGTHQLVRVLGFLSRHLSRLGRVEGVFPQARLGGGEKLRPDFPPQFFPARLVPDRAPAAVNPARDGLGLIVEFYLDLARELFAQGVGAHADSLLDENFHRLGKRLLQSLHRQAVRSRDFH